MPERIVKVRDALMVGMDELVTALPPALVAGGFFAAFTGSWGWAFYLVAVAIWMEFAA